MTRDALLRRILEDPADDAARLVFADWCEENGESERAEFIRVQITAPSKRKADKIIDDNLPLSLQWFDLPSPIARIVRLTPFDNDSVEYPYGIARRGFLDELRCPLNTCHANCHFFAAHPITRVHPTDRRPALMQVGALRWWTWERQHHRHPGNARMANELPSAVFDRLPGSDAGTTTAMFATASSAEDWLSDICVDIARELVGLPPMPRESRTSGCVCPRSCDVPCRGDCGCGACEDAYQDFLSIPD